jgi:hypothetical protein
MSIIYSNPVNHGYVARVCGWPYNSFQRFVEKRFVIGGSGDLAQIEGQFGE